MNEVVAIAKAKGLMIPDGLADKLIEDCLNIKEGLPSSMLMDHMAGRPTEVEVHIIRRVFVRLTSYRYPVRPSLGRHCEWA